LSRTLIKLIPNVKCKSSLHSSTKEMEMQATRIPQID